MVMSWWEQVFCTCYAVLILSAFVYVGAVHYGYVKHPTDAYFQRTLFTTGDIVWCTVEHFSAPMYFDEKTCPRNDNYFYNCCKLAEQRSSASSSITDHWLPRAAWWAASWVVNPLLDGVPSIPKWMLDALCWPVDALIGK